MLKVLLAYRSPDEGFDEPRLATLPPSLPWLAAAARAGGASATVANLSRLSWKDVERFLGEAEPDLLVLAVFTGSRRPAGRLARLAKKLRPGCRVVATGPHASALPVELLRRWKALDAVLPGEGERTLRDLCERLGEHGPDAIASQPGLILRDRRPEQLAPPVADLDTLAPPPGDLELAGVEPERDLRWISVSRPRGSAEQPRPAALRTMRRVVREMLDRRKRFGLLDFSLLGPGLVAERDVLFALAGELKTAKAGMTWELAARAEDLEPAPGRPRDRERLRQGLQAAAEAGCRRVRFELQSGAGPLDARRRLLAAASERLREAGLLPVATVRLGDPELRSGEELDELRALLRALRPASVDLEPRLVLPGHPDAPAEVWFEDERPVLMEAGEARVEKVAEALEPSIREILREAKPGPRELEARRARGGGAWLEMDWSDYRAAAGDEEEAERHLRRAAELEPWSAQPWLRLASLLARRDADGEREALREVLHRVPHHAGARARLDELRGGSSRRGGRRRRRPPA